MVFSLQRTSGTIVLVSASGSRRLWKMTVATFKAATTIAELSIFPKNVSCLISMKYTCLCARQAVAPFSPVSLNLSRPSLT